MMKKQRLLSLRVATGLKIIISLFAVASYSSAERVMLPDLPAWRFGLINGFVRI